MCGHPAGTRCASDTRGRCEETIGQYGAAHPSGPAVDPVTAATVTARGPARPTNPAPSSSTLSAQQRAQAAQALASARTVAAAIIRDAARRGRVPNTDPAWASAVQAVHQANLALVLLDHPELRDGR